MMADASCKSAVKAVIHKQVEKYITPTGSPRAEMKPKACVLAAFLASWTMWLDHLPSSMRAMDAPKLFNFVLSLGFELPATIGQIELDQRLELLRRPLSEEILAGYALFLNQLSTELDQFGPKVLDYWMQLSVPDGILFDQLANGILYFGVRCHEEDVLEEQVFRLMFDFVGALTTAMYSAPRRSSEQPDMNPQ